MQNKKNQVMLNAMKKKGINIIAMTRKCYYFVMDYYK